ncbi:MAG: hypothetical protein LBV08_10915 [Clostridiales bacterium]|jgi:hypothetical protein|nr:hypothetical protein [Clostridiales bacterium]
MGNNFVKCGIPHNLEVVKGNTRACALLAPEVYKEMIDMNLKGTPDKAGCLLGLKQNIIHL